MDPSFQGSSLSANHSLRELKILETNGQGGGVAGAEFCPHTVLRINFSSSVLHKSALRDVERKCILIDKSSASQACSFLSLEFGQSSSSSNCKGSSATVDTSFPLTKEVDKESSASLSLDFSAQFDSVKMRRPKKSASACWMVTPLHPTVDLELSLSAGLSESDARSVQPSSFQSRIEKHMSLSDGGSAQFDEGSTSSRLKTVSAFPRLENFQSNLNITVSNPVQGKTCPAPIYPELSSSVQMTSKGSVSCTSSFLLNQRPHQNSRVRKCQIKGCEKGARGASGRCISHGGGRRCQKPYCQKGAEGRTVYCKAHGGGRRCEYLGCLKSAEGCTDFCIAHGGGWRCTHEGCTHAARGKTGYCIRHGGGKRCQKENCAKSAEGHSGLCISHGGGRRCQFPGCTKCAQGSTKFCKAHGGGKRCTFARCTKGAEGSTLFCKGHGGGKRCAFHDDGVCTKSVHGATNFCVAHGGGKRCIKPECTKSARGKTDFCVRHGGGKRCRYEACDKSAQGSTDYCKGHGGGKRCSWGHPESEYGFQASGPCNSYPRGKTGLCALHNGCLQDRRVQGCASMGLLGHNPESYLSQNIKDTATAREMDVDILKLGISTGNQTTGACSSSKHYEMPNINLSLSETGTSSVPIHVPEGRVHGGSLMAALVDSSNLRSSNKNGNVQDTSGPNKIGMIPPDWI